MRVLFTGANADLARGAAFGLALSDPTSASLLGDVAVHAGTTTGGPGAARDQKLANGCVAALGLISTDDAVATLGRVQHKVKNRNVRKQIDRSLQEAAAAAHVSVDEMVERVVPSHGLGPGGFRDETHGSDLLRTAVAGDKVRVLIAKPKGGWTTTVPARVRDSHGEALSELRRTAKEATKTLVVEKLRVESLLASGPDLDRCRLETPVP